MICVSIFIQAQELEQVRSQANMGNAEAQFMLGSYYLNNGNTENGLKWIRKSADEKGFAPAQWFLGGLYYDGKFVTQSSSEAKKWFRKSADQDFCLSQISLGALYYDDKDWNNALYWCEKAQINYNKASKQEQNGYAQMGFNINQLVETINELKTKVNSNKINSTTPSAPNTSTTKTPNGKIEKVWVEHNIISPNGNKCMKIHISFSVNNVKGVNGSLMAAIYLPSGNDYQPVEAMNFTPTYDNSKYEDFVMYGDESNFDYFLSKIYGRYIGAKLKVSLTISNIRLESDYIPFTYDKTTHTTY